jgi:hypothetical protein
MRFPWNKPPSDIWAPGHLILYAVGAGTLIGIQQVDGPPQLRPRRGAPGSVENRWPHKLAVKTEVVCSPVSAAPKLRDVAPEIAVRYRKRFRNGSHWKLDDSEYKRLAEIVRSAGSASKARSDTTAAEVCSGSCRPSPGLALTRNGRFRESVLIVSGAQLKPVGQRCFEEVPEEPKSRLNRGP